MITQEGVELPEGTIADSVQDSFKYLGIPQANSNHDDAGRKSTTTKNQQRVRQVLKSWLNRKNKVRPSTHIPCQSSDTPLAR